MNHLIWNCRGLGNPSTVRQLVWLSKQKHPDVVFLMETKLLTNEWNQILGQMGFSNFVAVDCECTSGGRRGGLCLLWLDDISVTIKSWSNNHILAAIDDSCQPIWDFCGIYGWSRTEEHHLTWSLMRSLLPQVAERWMCGGDFNETLFHFEKVGGIAKNDTRLGAFRSVVEECSLSDLGFNGEPYTWTNNQSGDGHILERLDRIFANEAWITTFPGYEVSHLMRKSSDHCPLFLALERQDTDTQRRPRPFRFEAMWLKEEKCKAFCAHLWESGGAVHTIGDLKQKLTDMGPALKQWEKLEFGHIKKRCADIRMELVELQKPLRDPHSKDEQRVLEKELDDLLAKEEIMWKQRSRADWMEEGDRNSGFFHKVAEGRKKRNHIKAIQKVDGSVTKKNNEMDEIFKSHFQTLFTAGSTHNPAEVLSSIEPVVTEEMNRLLTAPYTQDEIVQALKLMHPLKAPGPDGMPALFYSSCWASAKFEIIPLLLNVLNHGESPQPLNSTFLCLIPKKKKCLLPSDFRPISLCNVVYKLVSKVISNRLKLILPSIIHESQSAFVPGRHITDNALLAFEIFHLMKLNKARAHGIFAFKLDMAKAYDRVEWSFLEAMMRHLGFHSSVVDLIMRCVTSVSFRVLVNGCPGTEFEPSRGLRQGDPLSPFLFLFCAEALSGLLRQAETRELLHGARLCRTAPRISHLLFADDCIVFGRANTSEIGVIADILQRYENVSGQMVNLDKSTISFSSGVLEVTKELLAGQLGVQCQGRRGSYLGIPSTVGRSKAEIFQMLVDRTRKKSKDWKRRFLSGAGKIVLIKSILQSIPTYLMSCFAIPDQICQKLNSVAASFFWGQKLDERRIHWKSWKKLCMAKADGGLGFRDLIRFNQAMLAKQVWRLAQNETSLLARSLKARYYPRTDIFLASKAHNPSFAWTSLLVGKNLLQNGIAWRLGDGARIRMGIDAWLPDGKGNYHTASVPRGKEEWCPNSMLLENVVAWDLGRLAELLPASEVWKITSNFTFDSSRQDRFFWPHGRGNSYSVKSGYYLAESIQRREEPSSSANLGHLWNWIWGMSVIPKVKLFMWKCLAGVLPTSQGLRGRSIDVDPLCRRCGEEIETTEHVLRDCKWSAFLWEVSPLRLRQSSHKDPWHIPDWFDEVRSLPHRELHSAFANLAWSVWYARNLLLFQGKEISHIDCIHFAQRASWTKRVCDPIVRPQPCRVDCSRREQVKIWSDAAVDPSSGMGYGIICKDREGSAVGSKYGFLPGVFLPVEAEARAVLEGINLCKEKGYHDVIVEMDCQVLFWLLEKKDPDLSYLGKTLDSIHSTASTLHHHTFSWTPREGNELADSLAKHALHFRSPPCFTAGLSPLLHSYSVQ